LDGVDTNISTWLHCGFGKSVGVGVGVGVGVDIIDAVADGLADTDAEVVAVFNGSETGSGIGVVQPAVSTAAINNRIIIPNAIRFIIRLLNN